MRIRIALAIVAVAAPLAALAGWLTVETRRNRMVWDHFDETKRGVLYRSGQLNGDQLRAAIKRYGIRTVVNFQVPGPEVEAERDLVKGLGVEFLSLPMPGDGFGRESQFREVLAACDDPERRPVLVHCARGTCRTGAAVALYRFERDGWTLADVSAEMERQSYRHGWLPGYVFGMVEDRPRDEMSYPAISVDRTVPPLAEAPADAR